MKKILFITSFLLGISFFTFGQNNNSEVEQYQKLKKEGSLPINFKFSNPEIFTPRENKKPKGPNDKSSNCGCYVAPDGTYTLAMTANDDGSTAALPIPFNFCLYGTNYTSLYINNNGNVSFGAPYSTFSSNPFPDPSFVMVAPFWGDVDTRSAGSVWYKITPTAMYVNWEGVGYYNSMSDKLNTFQLIITDGTDPVLPAGNNIAFCYGDMQWTTGSASGGTGGFGGTPATVGVNKGDGTNFIQLGRFDQPGSAYDGGGGANDGVSWLDNQSFFFNVCSGTNIAPIANFTPSVFNGGGSCDTLRVCGTNDTLLIEALFLSPEIGETTTVSINLNGNPGFTVLNNTPGNPATSTVQVVASPANAGLNTITYTATDNGVPSQQSVVNINVFVDTTGLSAFNPVINGQLEFCSGSNTTLTVNPTNYDSYIWNTGSIDTTITVNTGGEYWVTSESNGCYKTSTVDVIEHPTPSPTILGPLFTCSSNPTTLYIDSTDQYSSITWSPNASTNDSISVLSGTFSVTVTDTNNCTGTSPSVTVINSTPTVAISGNLVYCQDDSTTLTANPSISSGANYNWSTGDTVSTTTVSSVGSVWVEINYNNGCYASDTVDVTMNPTVFGSHNDTICQGNSYTLPGGGIVTIAGNYVDTLVSSTNCDSIVTTNLTVNPVYDATITPVDTLCDNGGDITLIAVDAGGIWNGTGITDSLTGSFSPSAAGAGFHNISYTINETCGDADNINILVLPAPDFVVTSLDDTCLLSKGSALAIVTSGLPPYVYSWSNGGSGSSINNVSAGSYSLTVSDSTNCSSTQAFVIGNEESGCVLIAPNVITPNGDGINDALVFDGLESYPGSSLKVFNRWGTVVYESSNYNNDWEPTDITDGTYYYILVPGGPIKADAITSTVTVLKD